MYLHNYFSSKTTHGGLIWSPKAKWITQYHHTPTYGTGILDHFPLVSSFANILVDKAPNAEQETFEIERVSMYRLQWLNKRTTYVARRQINTLTT